MLVSVPSEAPANASGNKSGDITLSFLMVGLLCQLCLSIPRELPLYSDRLYSALPKSRSKPDSNYPCHPFGISMSVKFQESTSRHVLRFVHWDCS